MKVYHFNTRDREDISMLFKIQNASIEQLGKELNSFSELDTALEDMDSKGYATLCDEGENIMFNKDIVFLIINHKSIIYMLEEEFNSLVIDI